MSAIVITTTTDTEQEARRIADTLLQKRLAACVQIIPSVESRYWWRGKLEATPEWLCLVKTTESKYPAIELAIRAGHSYDEPEIIALPVAKGSKGYLDWIKKETNSGAG